MLGFKRSDLISQLLDLDFMLVISFINIAHYFFDSSMPQTWIPSGWAHRPWPASSRSCLLGDNAGPLPSVAP